MLSKINWSTVTNELNPDLAYECFEVIFFPFYNSFFSPRVIKFNKNIHKGEKWITKGLLVSRLNKNILMKKSIVAPTPLNILNFKNYRNVNNKLVRASKKLYFTKELSKNTKNLKKTWSILNEVLMKKTKSKSLSAIIVNGAEITDKKSIADNFNKFFTSVASKIASNINPPPPNVIPPPVPVPEHDAFDMSSFPIQQAEFIVALNCLKSKYSLDLNNLSMQLVKIFAPNIKKPLIHIFSRSVLTGTPPKKFKIEKVVPIFKAGDPLDMNNFRPISLLSNFSKILEKIVHLRLVKFLDSKSALSDKQFGFRNSHSTIHPMTHLLNAAARALNSKKHLLVIFCDLQKAFDICNISILLKKTRKCRSSGLGTPVV